MTDDRAELEDPDDPELIIDGDAGEPTAEERAEVERAWWRGELLPPPWVVIDLSGEISRKTGLLPAGTYAMIKAPKVWAERFAEEMNLAPEIDRGKPTD